MAEKELYPVDYKFVYDTKDSKLYPVTHIFTIKPSHTEEWLNNYEGTILELHNTMITSYGNWLDPAPSVTVRLSVAFQNANTFTGLEIDWEGNVSGTYTKGTHIGMFGQGWNPETETSGKTFDIAIGQLTDDFLKSTDPSLRYVYNGSSSNHKIIQANVVINPDDLFRINPFTQEKYIMTEVYPGGAGEMAREADGCIFWVYEYKINDADMLEPYKDLPVNSKWENTKTVGACMLSNEYKFAPWDRDRYL